MQPQGTLAFTLRQKLILQVGSIAGAVVLIFYTGDGAAARRWSDQGRYHDNMMRQLHTQAANAIFDSRNKNLSSNKVCKRLVQGNIHC